MLIIVIGSRLYAQNRVISGDLQYTTELQSNFKNRCNWVNLLGLNVQLSTEAIGMWQNGFLDMELISIYRTAEERILDDKQVFSNIDEANQPLRISTWGYTQVIGRTSLFFGLRNVNRDYFTTPYTSLFTNSSCGIYPTIAANYPLANYPLSAMCLHAEYETDNSWSIKTSCYNGLAYESLGQVFTIRPKQDGIFNMTQISYTQNSTYDGIYSLGSAIHSRMPVRNENSASQLNEKETSQKKTKVDYSLWANIEQCIYAHKEREVGVVAQASYSPLDCTSYYGVETLLYGFVTSKHRDVFGLHVGVAKYQNTTERAIEFTWSMPISKHFTIQPAYHRINSTNIAMVRVYYNFGF